MKRELAPIWKEVFPILLVYLLVRISFNQGYGFHRDEFLYLAQGKRIAWGFWSNPPGPGFWSGVIQNTLGDSLWAIRFLPAVLATAIVYLTVLTSREFGAGKFGQFLAMFSMIVAGSILRACLLYNPVPFDILYWTFYTFILARFIRSEDKRLLILFGLAVGIGLLNKYSVVLMLAPLLFVFAISKWRWIYVSWQFYAGIAAATLVFLPNFIWQLNRNFPVIGHMRELSANQLSNVNRIDFLLDQMLFNINILPVWAAGFFFFFAKHGNRFRILAWLFVTTVFLIMMLKGKSYYTIGIYPVMVAGGACMWEIWSRGRKWLQWMIPVLSLAIIIPVLPFTWPFLSPPNMVAYGKKSIQSFLRWEDGEIHELPQDFGDMFGWEELAGLVVSSYEAAPERDKCLIYCSNFGQAGAVEHFGQVADLPPVRSFADSWLLWLPEKVPQEFNTLIYVNDNLGSDVADLFEDVKLMGQVSDSFAREQGTQVYLCQNPRSSLADFFNGRMEEVRVLRGLK